MSGPPSLNTPLMTSQVVRFALVGMAGTVAYLAAYAVLRHVLPAQAANLTARLVVAVPTTWTNGRHTFASSIALPRLYVGALVVLVVGVVITAVPLALEQVVLGPDHHPVEVVVLTGATLIATVTRFLLLRNWLFRPPAATTPVAQPTGS